MGANPTRQYFFKTWKTIIEEKTGKIFKDLTEQAINAFKTNQQIDIKEVL